MPAWLILFLSLTGALLAVKLCYLASTALALPATQGALFVSSPRARVEAALSAVDPRPGQRLVDLGCGDGRVIRMAARRYGLSALGYELNLMAWAKARIKCLGTGAVVKRENFFRADLGGADLVFCYLFPDVLTRLAGKLASGTRPGTVVVSFNFPLSGWRPERIIRPQGSLNHDPIFIYRTPAADKG